MRVYFSCLFFSSDKIRDYSKYTKRGFARSKAVTLGYPSPVSSTSPHAFTVVTGEKISRPRLKGEYSFKTGFNLVRIHAKTAIRHGR